MIVADSSPLIVLGRLDRLDILESLFGKIIIPYAVFQETVTQSKNENQKKSIQHYISKEVIRVVQLTDTYPFTHKLHKGEKEVLSLAVKTKSTGIILDEKRARKEAIRIGLSTNLLYTTDILREAEARELIPSYSEIIHLLKPMRLYLPE